MVTFIYGDSLTTRPMLANGMFRDRASQFRDRHGWDVTVSDNGHETDEYDALNPLYIIAKATDGSHAGSMRFLPTTGPVMVNDHFRHLTDGVAITSPLIWECTRFCISPKADKGLRVSARLMLAAAVMGEAFHIQHALGVFDQTMVRMYRLLGWSPDIVGTGDCGSGAVSVGLWDFGDIPFEALCRRAGATKSEAEGWLREGLFVNEAKPALNYA